jgi:alpha-1,6-mannosyltransferase
LQEVVQICNTSAGITILNNYLLTQAFKLLYDTDMMPLLLALFVTSAYFLAQYGNMGKDIYPFLTISIVQYGLYFYFLKNIFSEKKLPMILITLCAAICFGVYLYFPPKLSNDVYRYLWDGLLVKSDINPYQYVPSEWKLHDLQEANMSLYRKVDWRDKFTPYPPLAQHIFVGAHTLYGRFGLAGGKFVLALPFILSSALIYFLFDKRLYAAFVLNPLFLLEGVANAHLDGWVVFFMIIGLFLYQKQKYIPAAFIWLLAVATKIYPIIFVPFFVVDLLRRKKFLEVCIISILSLVTVYLFYRPFVSDSFFAITHYLTLPNEQEYNASLYRYLYHFMGIARPGVFILAGKICALIFAGSIFFLALWKHYSYLVLLSASILYLLCSPIVFPWYALFTFPFILFHVQKTKDMRLLFFFAFMECILTLIYFEPGKLALRETMLNVEYLLLLISILWYTKVLRFYPRKTA